MSVDRMYLKECKFTCIYYVYNNVVKKFVIDNDKLMLDWDWVKNNKNRLDQTLLTCGNYGRTIKERYC